MRKLTIYLIGIVMAFGLFVMSSGCYRGAAASPSPLPVTAVHMSSPVPVIAEPKADTVIARR